MFSNGKIASAELLRALVEEEIKYYQGFAYTKEETMDCKEIVKRLEDIGRLNVMLANLLEHKLFDIMEDYGIRRPKDACERFDELSEEKRDDMIHKLAYAIEDIRDDIADCLVVVEGEDG